MTPLPRSFYLREDVVQIARDLIGKTLFTCFDGSLTGGMIVETEAYAGIHDRASHSFGGRRTKRNEMMYQKGGVAYVYLCYGMHHLLNFVTNQKESPQGVLIRAIEPTHGVEKMQLRRKKDKMRYSLTSGPGTVSQALGIDLACNGAPLTSPYLWVEESFLVPLEKILASPRIGVEYAKEDALLPYRFHLKGNPWVSR